MKGKVNTQTNIPDEGGTKLKRDLEVAMLFSLKASLLTERRVCSGFAVAVYAMLPAHMP